MLNHILRTGLENKVNLEIDQSSRLIKANIAKNLLENKENK